VTPKAVLSGSLLLLAAPGAFAQQTRIAVLGLFHPREITLSAGKGEAVVVAAADRVFVLEPGVHAATVRIEASEPGLLLEFNGRLVHADEIRAAGRDCQSVSFRLGIPGKISRTYHGTLSVRAIDREVVPIVAMDLETAVASVVAAESTKDTPLEALKAQAVVTRSYFLAGKGRHHEFDFCDAAHCQVLREPPSPESPSAVATVNTRGMFIAYDEKPIAAMFTRSCGGHTRTPTDVGISPGSYPFYSVVCDVCYKAPVRWIRRVSEQDAAQLVGKGEVGRLAVDRHLGWNAVPSNNFTAREEGEAVILEGAGQGHGIGLCQRGARAMAEGGASFREIISHYFPNTVLHSLGTLTAFLGENYSAALANCS
jgi:stage II sporulation protein D